MDYEKAYTTPFFYISKLVVSNRSSCHRFILNLFRDRLDSRFLRYILDSRKYPLVGGTNNTLIYDVFGTSIYK